MDKFNYSIIVPVYNVENYLKKCIDSILVQSYDNYEIILINDGSTDNSPEICNQYANTQPQKIKYISQENMGLSEARNSGIKYATGNYILFIDSDDYYDDAHFLEKITKRLDKKKSDILNFSYKKVNLSTNEATSYFKNNISLPDTGDDYELINCFTKNGLYIASACNKAIKSDLFNNNDLFFRKNIYSEDIEWCARLLLCAQTIDFINLDAYCYCQRSNSITHTINDKKCSDLCNNIISCVRLSENANINKKNLLLAYSAYQMGTFFKVQTLADNVQTANIEKLKEYSYILMHHNGNKKVYLLYLLVKIFGFEFTCKILRMIFKKVL